MPQRRCVIVAGLPRSGTSWLAKSLSFARDFTYYREPDNVVMVAGAEDRFRTLYLTRDDDDPAYRRLMTRALTGQLATRFTMREAPGPLITALGHGRGLRIAQRFPILFFRKRHVLVKLVNSNLNLDWLTGNFPTRGSCSGSDTPAVSSRAGNGSAGSRTRTPCSRTVAWSRITPPRSPTSWRAPTASGSVPARCGRRPYMSFTGRLSRERDGRSSPTSGSAPIR